MQLDCIHLDKIRLKGMKFNHLKAIVCPGSKKHGAVLFIKREVFDVDCARRPEYHHRKPRYITVICHHHVRTY